MSTLHSVPSAPAFASAAPSATRAAVRDDVVRLPGNRWTMWAWASLRGAGFPVADVLRLSSPQCARLAVQLLQARARRSGSAGGGAGGRESPTAALAALTEAFAAEMRRIKGALRDVAADHMFREAVIWQNRRAFRNSLVPLAAAGVDDTSSETRKRELLVTSYLQRYCVKNDTIGYFGPVGWVRFTDGPQALAITCGPSIIAERNSYFEGWCLDTLARMFDNDARLRPWNIPRLQPFVRLDGAQLVMGSRVVRECTPDQVRLLQACDGERNAQTIARDLRARGSVSFLTSTAVYDLLEQWRQAGYVVWTFEGARELHPERTLRRRLACIDEPALRDEALRAVDEIDACGRGVREAAGRGDALDGAIERLESTFNRITGVAATRREGETYAARTLIYEECRRDTDVEMGASVVARLGPPLSLILQSLRWALHEIARRQAIEFRRAFDELTGVGPTRPINLAIYLSKLSLVVTARTGLSTIGTEVRSLLQQRWAEVLQPPPAAHRLTYRSRALRASALAAFAAPEELPTTWARTVSPDVMIDAPSHDAFERGDYQLVLGEIHAVNTMQQPVFLDQHPRREALLRSLDLDYPRPRVMWIDPKDVASHRVHFMTRPNDYAYLANREPSPAPPERTLRTADMEVVDEAGALFVQTRDGRRRFSCMEFFGCLMTRGNVNLFDVLPHAAHRPRVTIDDVVVCREQWQLPVREMKFATLGNDLDRFVECRRWASQHELPPYVFVKLPDERKPSYVDLESPVFVDLFAKAVRGAQRADAASVVSMTEMLPAHGGTWLTDAQGRRYTSELRIVAVAPDVGGSQG